MTDPTGRSGKDKVSNQPQVERFIEFWVWRCAPGGSAYGLRFVLNMAEFFPVIAEVSVAILPACASISGDRLLAVAAIGAAQAHRRQCAARRLTGEFLDRLHLRER
ncbi:hypothetical protein [Streptomyces sp. enrichment culture]|uniref:hypothetical protein n=1 Tax=Streptomyces sp. enrichment culture TaxID=1795815 RepID=UPI003F544938